VQDAASAELVLLVPDLHPKLSFQDVQDLILQAMNMQRG
jgi:hypothetical protein